MRKVTFYFWLAALSTACWFLPIKIHAQEPPKEYRCQFASSSIEIDGELSDSAWQNSAPATPFGIPWLGKNAAPSKAQTKARLLWDREYLYFAAELEDRDLFADVLEHDGVTWNNDVFELFLKPTKEHPGYYEFQVNAAGTKFDMFVPDREHGELSQYVAADTFHIEAKVKLNGSLNQRSDRDNSWTVEGRIPWYDFWHTGGRPGSGETWSFALCRYDYDAKNKEPELSSSALLKEKSFHRTEDYTPIRFCSPKETEPELASFAQALNMHRSQVDNRLIGTPDPPPPYRSVRKHPQLSIQFPICVEPIPGSKRLLVIDQQWAYGPARLAMTASDPPYSELIELWKVPNDNVAYSLAFHPQFQENGYFYVGWNGNPDGGPKKSIISRFQLQTSFPYSLIPDSQVTIIEWDSDGHNGAAIAFGKDGMLYVTSGDGTSDSDRNVQGQGLDHLRAKVLRIDVDHPASGKHYSIPKDNPFVNQPGAAPETWAYGLRNPWRITSDPVTGQIWVGNNGQDLWEQVYLIERGANYGWSIMEGSHPFYVDRPKGPTPFSKPTFEHHHSEARSLTGGIVYRGTKFPDLVGAYIYADYSTGKIWAGRTLKDGMFATSEIADTPLMITCITADHDGELLITDHRKAGQGIDAEGGLYGLELNTQRNDTESKVFPRKLSETGLFASVANHQVHPGLIPYSVNSPLWSDGASKDRYVYIPTQTTFKGHTQESRIEFPADQGWNLPNGSVTLKSFSYPTQVDGKQKPRWLETRVMIKQDDYWTGYSYRWNEEQTDATLVENAGLDEKLTLKNADGTDYDVVWHYPSRTECMVCHTRAANFVLGINTLQLNKTNRYGEHSLNQIELFERLGLLVTQPWNDWKNSIRNHLKSSGIPDEKLDAETEILIKKTSNQRQPTQQNQLLATSPSTLDRLVDPHDATQNLEKRAKSYLHSNCSVCHVEAGGGNAQIDLDYRKSLKEMKIVDVNPVHHRFELKDAKLIAPGAPDRSVLLHRMSIRTPGQMPQLATQQVDQQAVSLIREWIETIEPLK